MPGSTQVDLYYYYKTLWYDLVELHVYLVPGTWYVIELYHIYFLSSLFGQSCREALVLPGN